MSSSSSMSSPPIQESESTQDTGKSLRTAPIGDADAQCCDPDLTERNRSQSGASLLTLSSPPIAMPLPHSIEGSPSIRLPPPSASAMKPIIPKLSLKKLSSRDNCDEPPTQERHSSRSAASNPMLRIQAQPESSSASPRMFGVQPPPISLEGSVRPGSDFDTPEVANLLRHGVACSSPCSPPALFASGASLRPVPETTASRSSSPNQAETKDAFGPQLQVVQEPSSGLLRALRRLDRTRAATTSTFGLLVAPAQLHSSSSSSSRHLLSWTKLPPSYELLLGPEGFG